MAFANLPAVTQLTEKATLNHKRQTARAWKLKKEKKVQAAAFRQAHLMVRRQQV